MEDRVLLDAAGVVDPTLILAAPVVPAASTLDSTPTATAAASRAATSDTDSLLQVDNNTLIFSDVTKTRDNQLVISMIGGRLSFRDISGGTIGTDLDGAVGDGSNNVSIALAGLNGVDRLVINLEAGRHTLVFDYSRDANTLLGQFSSVVAHSKIPSNLTVQFVGNRATDFVQNVAAHESDFDFAQISTANHSTVFELDAQSRIDVTQMQVAEVGTVGPNVGRVEISAGTDSLTGQRAAIVVQIDGPSSDSRAISFFDNESLVVRSVTGSSSSRILVHGSGSQHQNSNLILQSEATGSPAIPSVSIDGPLFASGNLSIDAEAIRISSSIDVGRTIDMTASKSIALMDTGMLSGRMVSLITSGQIDVSQATAPHVIVAQRLHLEASENIAQPIQPLRTRVDALSASVTNHGGLFVSDAGNLTVLNVTAGSAGLQVLSGGTLTITEQVAVSDAGPISLQAANGDLRIRGQVATTSGNIDLAASNSVTTTNRSRISTQTGTITIRPDTDLRNGGSLQLSGAIANSEGTTVLWSVNGSSQFRGILSGNGDVVKLGAGTLTIASQGQFAHHGKALIEQGTLAVDGSITSSSLLVLANQTTLQGAGLVRAPVFSDAVTSQIIATGRLRLGDGSSAGFDYAGTLTIQPGQTLVIHDSDRAQLGRTTQLLNGATLIAPGGLQVGSGGRVIGSGTIQSTLVVASGGVIAPGPVIGQLRITNLAMLPGSTLELDIRGTQLQAFDRLIVPGQVMVDGAVLQINTGTFRIPPGVNYQLIQSTSTQAVSGFFINFQGAVLGEGTQLSVAGAEATISYRGGAQLTGVVLSTEGRIFFIPLRAGGERFATFFVPVANNVAEKEEANDVVVQRSTQEDRVNVEFVAHESHSSERDVEQGERLFLRVYDDALRIERDQELELDPKYLANLPSLFEDFRFPNGHYRVYVQPAGSEQIRLVLDVHVFEGRVVPENFREEERPFIADSTDTTNSDEQAEEPSDAESSPGDAEVRQP